jgi:hypothetical protein
VPLALPHLSHNRFEDPYKTTLRTHQCSTQLRAELKSTRTKPTDGLQMRCACAASVHLRERQTPYLASA